MLVSHAILIIVHLLKVFKSFKSLHNKLNNQQIILKVSQILILIPNQDQKSSITVLKRKQLQKWKQNKKQIHRKNSNSRQDFSKYKKKKSSKFNKSDQIKRDIFFSPNQDHKQKKNIETCNFIKFDKQVKDTKQNKFLSIQAFKQFKKLKQISQVKASNNQKILQCPKFLKKQSNDKISHSDGINQTKDFKILKKIGQGTFGQAFTAIHTLTGSIYTLKRQKKSIIKQHQLQNKFIHDIKVQLKMDHPHIVKLYGFMSDQSFFYMIFQHMPDGNLSEVIQKYGGKMNENEINKKIHEIGSAIVYLHQKNQIHRQIKPVSILLFYNVCKICDTEWLQENQKVSNFILCKQINYAAPQALQGKQITPQFDVWGLGLIVFQLLTGKKLIQATEYKSLLRQIITLQKQMISNKIPKSCSKQLRNFILKCLEPLPLKRLKSCEIQKSLNLSKQKQLSSILISK